MGSRALVIALTACVLGLFPKSADACKCAPKGPPCEAIGQADAVFVGRVLSIDSRPDTYEHLVRLSVTEGFRGFQLSQVTVTTGLDQASCGYRFQVGESYVVYARRSPQGQLSTSTCSRTAPIAKAGD